MDDPQSVYDRRRADLLLDKRVDRIEVKVDQLTRYVFVGSGIISVVIVIMYLIGTLIVSAILRGMQP